MAEPGGILVVEDDPSLRRLLVEVMEDDDHAVRAAGTLREAVSLIEARTPELILTDLRLPDGTGLELLARSQALPDPPTVVVITGFGTIAQAVEALKLGAQDFLTKPLELDHLSVRIQRAIEARRLRAELRRFREILGDGDFHGMIGGSEPMQALFDQVGRMARGVGPVLIEGESGVGKELVARALHEESDRRDGPLLAVNCAGVPPELLESEFFGHARGAFTGARTARKGLFVEADGGTLLLDEIGEMSQALQAKLLRVLQEGRVRPVGSDRDRKVDVRVVAATNRTLEEAVSEGTFRQDLFFRLETFRLRVPPLRDREGDLPLLVGHFVGLHATRLGKQQPEVSPEVLARLQAHSFPGNVRELRNVLERAVTFCEGPALRPEHLPARFRAPPAGSQDAAPVGIGAAPGGSSSDFLTDVASTGLLPTLREMEARYVRYVVDRTGGNKRRAAALLGIARNTLYRKLDESADLQ